MKNVAMTIENNELVIRVNLKEDFGPSASGKTTIIGTTQGNQNISPGSDIKIGLNVYKPIPRAERE